MTALLMIVSLGWAPQTTVTYDGVAKTVVSIRVETIRDGHAVRDEAVPGGIDADHARVPCEVGSQIVVSFVRGDGAYELDGPFVCPDRVAERVPGSVWRRTARIRAPSELSARVDPVWLAANGDTHDVWPRCQWSGSLVECRGVPLAVRGVVVVDAHDRIWWTIVEGAATRPFQAAVWGRLVIAGGGSTDAGVEASIARPLPPPASRSTALRLDTALVPGAHVSVLAKDTIWITGDEVPPGSWLEVRAANGGPKYLALDEVAHAPVALPLWIALDESRTIAALARSPLGDAAAGTVMTLFRLIDPLPGSERSGGDVREQPPRRVYVDERIAGSDGAVLFPRLGDAEYEIVAWHPQFGRGIATVPRIGEQVVVRMESPGLVRGRVVSRGSPLAGVNVLSLPDPEAYAQSADSTDVKGGDARTGADGSFVVSLAPRGGGEVRVGGGDYPVRRFPLPRVPVPVVDLGEIELGGPIEVTFALDQDPGCDIRATGPIGRTGLQVIGGSRTSGGVFTIAFPEEGTWEVNLACGRVERSLAPPLVSITQASAGKEIRMQVR
jgi:hypothetical protein